MPSSFLSDLRPLLHPMVVHFPIALLFASVGLDWLGYALRRPGFTRAGFYSLALGALGAGAAAFVGPDEVSGDTAQALLGWHQLYALLTVTLAVALVAIRFFATDGIGGRWALTYLAGTLVLLAVVSMTGYYGGELTYHQGVGVTAVASSGSGATAALGPLAPAPSIHAKPLVVLLGFVSMVALAVWLAAGRLIAPAYYGRWWQAARQAGKDVSPIWTLRQEAGQETIQGTSQQGRAQPLSPSRYGPWHGDDTKVAPTPQRKGRP
jgi:uncharacterized membrane protein